MSESTSAPEPEKPGHDAASSTPHGSGDAAGTPVSGTLMVLRQSERVRASETIDHEGGAAPRIGAAFRNMRPVYLASVAALFGLVTGVAAMSGSSRNVADVAPQAALASETAALKETVAKLDAELSSLKAGIDRTSKARTAQLAKVGERLDKVEKGQEDVSSKVAKIGEAQDKLRMAAAPVPAAGAASPETTASIAAASKKPPIVKGWVLNRVSGGGAIVEGRTGLYEVYPGDPLPELGRVEAVRYQDGRWVVVTARGLIVKQ